MKQIMRLNCFPTMLSIREKYDDKPNKFMELKCRKVFIERFSCSLFLRFMRSSKNKRKVLSGVL